MLKLIASLKDLVTKLKELVKNMPQEAPQDQSAPALQAMGDVLVPWIYGVKGSENNRHNVRVLCDLKKLPLHRKNIITACVEQESDFDPGVEGRPNTNGTIDYGICQFNNGELHGVPLWIGQGAAFSSIEEVKANPEKCVNLMIDEFEAGHANWWMSYKFGEYLKFMPNGDNLAY
jgi:hypothetical protein